MPATTFFLGSRASGQHQVVRFGPLRFWAENGLIACEDERDNTYQTVSVRTALDRIRAINDMLGNSTQRMKNSEDQFDQANRRRHQDMVDAMVQIVRLAREQCNWDDDTSVRDVLRRMPTTFCMPGIKSAM